MTAAISACPALGNCTVQVFNAVYKAMGDYPKEALHVSYSTYKALNLAGPIIQAGLNGAAQALGWQRTKNAIEISLIADEEEAPQSAGHIYVPFILATGTLSIVQITTMALSGDPYYKATDMMTTPDVFVQNGVEGIVIQKGCSTAYYVNETAQRAFTYTMNFFIENFNKSAAYKEASALDSDASKPLFQMGGINMAASALLFGFTLGQVIREMHATKRLNPFAVMALVSSSFMLLLGLAEIISTTNLSYEEQAHKNWKDCQRLT